jgi:hypothetical protein
MSSATLQTVQLPSPVTDQSEASRTDRHKLAHIRDPETGRGICGAKVKSTLSSNSDSKKCVVCLDLAMGQRFLAR